MWDANGLIIATIACPYLEAVAKCANVYPHTHVPRPMHDIVENNLVTLDKFSHMCRVSMLCEQL